MNKDFIAYGHLDGSKKTTVFLHRKSLLPAFTIYGTAKVLENTLLLWRSDQTVEMLNITPANCQLFRENTRLGCSNDNFVGVFDCLNGGRMNNSSKPTHAKQWKFDGQAIRVKIDERFIAVRTTNNKVESY
jgi:hypothetical protein